MATNIVLKRSSTSGAVPSVSDLALGEIALNTYDGKMYTKKTVSGTSSIVEFFTSSAATSSAFDYIVYKYVATANQTTFSGNDANSVSLAYATGTLQVFLNGILLDPTDYTASNGTAVVLDVGASSGDILFISRFAGVNPFDDFKYVATANQTTFTGSDANSTTLAYTPGNCAVYLNGVLLDPTDFTATTGTTVVLASGAAADDILHIHEFNQTGLTEVHADTSPTLGGDLDMYTYDLVTTDNRNIDIIPHGTGNVNLSTDTVLIGASGENVTVTSNGTGDMTVSTNSGTNSGTVKILDGVNQNIEITPNGSGKINLDGLLWPNADGSANQYLQTDGSGNLSFVDVLDTSEEIQDTVGAMFSSNTETGITATYQDSDGTIDLVIGDDVIVQSMIADNAIDSQHYVDGSIDLAHMSANSIDSDQYVDGSIDLAHMSANSIDSDQYVDGSIDLVHMSINSIDSDQYVDGSIDTAHIADDAVTIAKMAGLARGKIIYGDASGNPAALAVGTSGQVLKSDGTDIAWATDATVAALTSEEVQDIAGAMFSSNTETGITATYQDADGTIDLVVGTLNQSTTGSAATLTTARAIAVAGDVTGTANFDGSAGISITTTLATDAIVTANITDANVTVAKMAANSIDSDQYVDGSIDTAHIADSQITVAKMAANSVDSDQYVDGSIDTAHIADDQVTGAKIENSVTIATSATSPLMVATTSARITQVALTSSSAAVAWDAAAAANAYHVTTENTTFSAPSNAVEGAIITLELAQGGTARTIAWNTVFEFAASTAPTVTATANKTDIFTFRYNGSVWQEIGRVQNMAQT